MFQKGNPGRAKGSKNKRSSFKERMAELNWDALADLQRILPDLRPKEQAQILADLVGYEYPKLKHQEIEADIKGNEGPKVVIMIPSNNTERIDGKEVGAVVIEESKKLTKV